MAEVLELFPDFFSKFFFLTGNVLFAAKIYLSSVIIGICVAQLKRSIKEKEVLSSPLSAVHFGENVVKEFRLLKWFLSPVMFVLFLVNSLNVIGDGYLILSFSTMGPMPRFVTSFLTLGYVCLVVHGCYGEFKSIADTLR